MQRAAKPIVVAMLSVILILCGTLCASSGTPPAAAAHHDAEYRYARLGPCRASATASDRRRPCVRAPTGNVITEFGPGSLRLQGTAGALRIEVHDSTIAAVLAAMGRAFAVRYRSSTALDDPVTGTYAGSLTHVLARVLDGYDYAITHDGPAVEVVVLGRSRGRAAPARRTPAVTRAEPAPPPPTPATVAPARRRCGRSAGHRAACAPN